MRRFLREDIRELPPYVVEQGGSRIKLDANEGLPREDGLHLYPDDSAVELRTKLGRLLGKGPTELLLGNGSSELVELVFKAFLGAGETVVSFSPTFCMYGQFALIHKGVYREYPLREMRHLDVEGFLRFVEQTCAKVVIICNPNNPTGTVISQNNLERIIASTDAVVVLDEAYGEFFREQSNLDPHNYPNLIVLRTFSKAWSLAGIRLGYMLASAQTIGYVNRVRPPYNLNTLTQRVGLEALNRGLDKNYLNLIRVERDRLAAGLKELGIKPFPSQTNFLFFPADKAVFDHLRQKSIAIRSFTGDLQGYYRVTIGTPRENEQFLQAVKEAIHAQGSNY